jgi:hypothetical protein
MNKNSIAIFFSNPEIFDVRIETSEQWPKCLPQLGPSERSRNKELYAFFYQTHNSAFGGSIGISVATVLYFIVKLQVSAA